jgi:hypothetical protein
METVNIIFTIRSQNVGGSIPVTLEDLNKGHKDTDVALDRQFNDMLNEQITDHLTGRNGGLTPSYTIDLSNIDQLKDAEISDIGIALDAFGQLYNIQRKLPLKPRIGCFDERQLILARNLYSSMNDEIRRIWIILSDYIGNERMYDLLSKLAAESLSNLIDEKQIALAVGYEIEKRDGLSKKLPSKK